jgi:photosystem II stability/assembly factor-like uncharacterized protein
MRAPRSAALGLAAAALCAGLARPAPPDPLETPALASRIAARRPLSAVDRAGERLVAVGERGHVVWSDDGGRSWSQAAVPVSADLCAVRFVSPERGWAAGHDGVVLATRDGGRTWSRQLDGRRIVALLEAERARHAANGPLLRRIEVLLAQGIGQGLLDVWLDEEGAGLAVGAFGLVLRTEDGGESWEPWVDRAENPRALHLHAVRRVAGEVYVAGERGLVLRLEPARRRLVALDTGYPGSFFGLAGSRRSVVAFGLRGHAFRSTDGGARWRRVETGVEAALTGGAALPDGRLVLVAQDGSVLVSSDGGASFAAVRGVRGAPASAVAAAGADAVVIAGPAGVRREVLPRAVEAVW